MAAPRQHAQDESGSTRDGVVFSFLVRQRIRETSQEVHDLVVERLRCSHAQGTAASPGSLAAEIRALTDAHRSLAGTHGPQRPVAQRNVRAAYKSIAASCIILAERATRPERELPRGKKSSTQRYRAPNFTVPEDAVAAA